MKLKHFLPWVSFDKKNLKTHSTLNFIRKGFTLSILISNFIFLSIFEIKLINTLAAFLSIYGLFLLLKSNKIVWFWCGFFIGILWFYWISFSFIYYGFWYLIPLVIIGIGFVYAVIFLVGGSCSNLLVRLTFLVAVGYFYPFNFNWFNLELIFVNTIFKPSILTLISVLIGLIFTIRFKFGIIVLLIGLILNINFSKEPQNLLPFKVVLANTNIAQSQKWEKKYKDKFISENLNLIDEAIKNKAKLIVLPESAFPLFLDHQKDLLEYLKQKSKFISIVAGALGYEHNVSYNSTYVFKNGNYKRFDKSILVPFGEEIPLPKFIAPLINKIFFNDLKDFGSAKNISNYYIDGIKITNAICYEASRDEIYKDHPKFVIAITNNAWFTPSTEPILQRILLKYYAFKYKTIIYHSVNGSKSEIITP